MLFRNSIYNWLKGLVIVQINAIPLRHFILFTVAICILHFGVSAFLFVFARLIGGSDNKLIYRHYATLYFVFCVDSSESELGILDLIQVRQMIFF